MNTVFMRPPRRTGGFTLLELIVVIGLITLLVALLLPAVSMVQEQHRRMAARKEVNELAAAALFYYNTYERWPAALAGGTPIPLTGALATLLSSGAYAAQDNPRSITFLRFSRTNGAGDPVNPWGNVQINVSSNEHRLYLMVDHDFDKRIPGLAANPADRAWNRPHTNDFRGVPVVAWTVNPRLAPGKPGYIIGSWTE
jgi:type II secretory pathway pseudopilin PulG